MFGSRFDKIESEVQIGNLLSDEDKNTLLSRDRESLGTLPLLLPSTMVASLGSICLSSRLFAPTLHRLGRPSFSFMNVKHSSSMTLEMGLSCHAFSLTRV